MQIGCSAGCYDKHLAIFHLPKLLKKKKACVLIKSSERVRMEEPDASSPFFTIKVLILQHMVFDYSICYIQT